MITDDTNISRCKKQQTKTHKQTPVCTISTKIAAAVLGVSRQHITKLVKHKRLTCLQDFRPYRFSVTVFSQETGVPVSLITAAAEAIRCDQ